MPLNKTAGNILIAAGVVIIVIVALFPQGVADSLATIKIDSTPPYVAALDPIGYEDKPSHFPPDNTVTLRMYSTENINNARVAIKNVDTGKRLTTMSLSYSGSRLMHKTPTEKTAYYFTGSWDTSGHSGEKLAFTFKGDDAVGNTGSDTAYAIIGSYADGYFEIKPSGGSWQKVSKGATITLSTRSVSLNATATTEEKPDEVWFTVKAMDVPGYEEGHRLKAKDDTVKTSPPYSWNYTFPEDGTYEVNGYFMSYGKYVQVMSISGGVNTSPAPPQKFPTETLYFAGFGVFLAFLGIGLRVESES